MPDFKPRATSRARELRNNASPAERRLWQHLSRSQLGGYKFSRQIPIGPYICDFVCRSVKLIVEVDGFSHNLRQEYNARRTGALQAEGYQIIRFTNEEVLTSVEGVLILIAQALAARPTPNPSRKREGSRAATHPPAPSPSREREENSRHP